MKELIAALAKAQSNMSNAELNKNNPYFNSKYADLSSIRDAVMPALSQQGVALVQRMESDDKGVTYVITELWHGDDCLRSETPVKCAANADAQKFGSALTYARRYAMAAICGISADEDDDGNAVPQQGNQKAKPDVSKQRNEQVNKKIEQKKQDAAKNWWQRDSLRLDPNNENYERQVFGALNSAPTLELLNKFMADNEQDFGNMTAEKYHSVLEAANIRKDTLTNG